MKVTADHEERVPSNFLLTLVVRDLENVGATEGTCLDYGKVHRVEDRVVDSLQEGLDNQLTRHRLAAETIRSQTNAWLRRTLPSGSCCVFAIRTKQKQQTGG